MKKLHAVLLVLGAAFLVYLVWKTNLARLRMELISLGWGLIPIILCEGLAELIHTVAWRYCMSGPQRFLPLLHLFRIRMAGYAITYLTPTGPVAGEVTKGALLATNHKGTHTVSGLLIERFCLGFAHLLLVIGGGVFILRRIKLPPALWTWMVISSVLLGGGMIVFLLLQMHGKLGAIIRWLTARKIGGRMLRGIEGNITEVDETLREYYRERPRDLWLSVGWHVVGHSVFILQAWFFLFQMNQHASLSVAVGAWFIGMWFDLLTFAVPMNLGTLEGSRIVALRAVGYNSLLGMTYGVVTRFAQLFWAAFGLATYTLLASQAARSVSNRTDLRNRADYQQKP